MVLVTYNDGTTDKINLTNENVKVTGFDNSKIGVNKVTVEYEGHTTTFDVEIVSEPVIENPKTGIRNIIIIIFVFFISIIAGTISYIHIQQPIKK